MEPTPVEPTPVENNLVTPTPEVNTKSTPSPAGRNQNNPRPKPDISFSHSDISSSNAANLKLGPNLTLRSSSVSDLAISPSRKTDSDFVFKDLTFGPVSPGIQDKISLIEQQSAGSKFFNMTPLENKRKSEFSPETDLSKKEKKILRSEEKKLKKHEVKAGRAIQVQKAQ